MATLAATVGTLEDLKSQMNEESVQRVMIDLLAEDNSMIKDAVYFPANNGKFHEVEVSTSLPSVYFRAINEPTPSSKGTFATVRESAAMLDTWMSLDAKLVAMRGGNKYLKKQAKLYIEALNQQVQQSVLYGNQATKIKEFTGLAPRYASLSAANANNIIDAGGTGSDNTSMWLIDWSEEGCHLFYPDGSQVGLETQNYGIVPEGFGSTSFNAQSHMAVYKTQFCWDLGLVLADYRQVVRICNIDVSNLKGSSGYANLFEEAMKATSRLHNASGRFYWYVNRTVEQWLKVQAYRDVKAGGGLTFDNVSGKNIMMLGGIPVHRCDRILNTEARIT